MNPRCHGVAPLTARREPWMDELLADAGLCERLVTEHGSPVNLVDTAPLARNAAELQAVADEFGVPLLVQVARKANKALAVVDEAARLGLGIDVGSERELAQVLARGVDPHRIILTAAVKPRRLLELAAREQVTVALDNLDEAGLLTTIAPEGFEVALRLAPSPTSGLAPSRFGEQAGRWLGWLADEPGLRVAGIHFHLHGYAAADRMTMLREALVLVDALREQGHPVRFVDIGGGIPMSYLDDATEWESFWATHRAALEADEPITWRGHPLATVYPYHQQMTRGPWLRAVLQEVAGDLTSRGLELRCEPGRAMLDGCGLTLARVTFRKQTSDGIDLVGVEMNRTQCRSTSDDFLVDPILVRPAGAGTPSSPVEAYLVGAYCIEAELILNRRLVFPDGVAVGDLIALPNTGGYLMHILESASHQIPLARNLSRSGEATGFTLDPIDA